MKQFCAYLLLICLFPLSMMGQGLSKAEKKALKKEVAFYMKNLELYEKLKEGKATYVRRIDSLRNVQDDLKKETKGFDEEKERIETAHQAQVDNLNDRIAKEEATVAELETSVGELDQEIARLTPRDLEAEAQQASEDGKTFKIQLASIAPSLKIPGFAETVVAQLPKISLEETEDKRNRYMLGTFSSRQEAEDFKYLLLDITNWPDAWIVTYENGVRVQ